jgi:cytochrome c biogenesis protein CcdA
MLRLIGIMVAIGLADSLNPSTVAPALFLASGRDPKRTVAEFSAGVFLVYFLGGVLITLGPGSLVLSIVPRPSHGTTKVLEVVAGVVLILGALLLWRYRKPLGGRRLPEVNTKKRGGWVLGASITAVELPTAFPYFGALAAVIGSGLDLGAQLLLVLIFNVCFTLPLLGIWLILQLGGDRAHALLTRARGFLERHWPLLLAAIALVAGGITIAIGATGAAKVVSGSFKRGFGKSLTKTLSQTLGAIQWFG